MELDKNIDLKRTLRFERNFVNYPVVFNNNFGADSNLILSILGYISSEFKNNLFGYTTFRLSDFCKKHGLYKNHLMDLHPLFKNIPEGELLKPKRGIVNPFVDSYGHVYKSVFDHCIYRMMKENVIFSDENAKGQSLTRVKHIQQVGGISSIQLLKSVRILNEHSRSANEEYVYELTLGSDIFQNMAYRYFIQMKEDNFIELGKNRAGINKRGLYFYLLGEQNRCLASKVPTNISTPNFDLLVRHAMLKNSKIRNNKQTLIKYLDLIGSKEYLNFKHNLKSVDLDDPKFKIIIEFQNLKYLESYENQRMFSGIVDSLENHFKTVVAEGREYIDNDEYLHEFQLWLNSTQAVEKIAEVIQGGYLIEKKIKLQLPAIRAAIHSKNYDFLLNGHNA
jgi:hypothetical protein